MHGSGVGTLRFLKRDPQGNIEELLSEDGNQDAVWRKLRIYLKEGVVEGSRIVIEARVGDDSGLGDIAIDDVVFHQGCTFIPDGVSTTPGPSTTTDPIKDGVDCDFENGWCGWSLADETGDFKFRLLDGQQVLNDDSEFKKNLLNTKNRANSQEIFFSQIWLAHGRMRTVQRLAISLWPATGTAKTATTRLPSWVPR